MRRQPATPTTERPSARPGRKRQACAVCALAVFVAAPPSARAQCPNPVVVAETRWRSAVATEYSPPVWITADGLGSVYAGFMKDGITGLYSSRDGGLSWDSGNFTVGEGSPDLRVTADSRTWLGFLAKERSLVWALLRRKIRIHGAARLLISFGKCFPS